MESIEFNLKEKIDNLNKLSNECLENFVLKGYLEMLARMIFYVELSDRNKAEEILLKMDEINRLKVRAIVEKIREKHFLLSSEIQDSVEHAFLLMGFSPGVELSEIVDACDNYDRMWELKNEDGGSELYKFSRENPVLESKLQNMYLGFYDLPNRVILESLRKYIYKFDIKMIAEALCPKQKELKEDSLDKKSYQKVVELFTKAYNDVKALELQTLIKELSGKLDDSEIVVARKELTSTLAHENCSDLVTEKE